MNISTISTISSFRRIENKHGVYRGKDCTKTFCESLREHAIKITNFKKKEMKLLTKEQQESYENAPTFYICKEKSKTKYLKDRNIVKLEVIVVIQGNIEVLQIAYKIKNIVHLKKFLEFFIMDLTMIMIKS